MRGGRRLPDAGPPLDAIRDRAAAETALLPDRITALARAEPAYPVIISPALAAYQEEVKRRVGV